VACSYQEKAHTASPSVATVVSQFGFDATWGVAPGLHAAAPLGLKSMRNGGLQPPTRGGRTIAAGNARGGPRGAVGRIKLSHDLCDERRSGERLYADATFSLDDAPVGLITSSTIIVSPYSSFATTKNWSQDSKGFV